MKKRDIGQEILESIRAIKRGEGKQYRIDLPYDPKAIRERMHSGTFGVCLIIRGQCPHCSGIGKKANDSLPARPKPYWRWRQNVLMSYLRS